MKGRIWLLAGVAIGIVVGIGKLPYFDGAATSLSDTALRVVNTARLSIIHGIATHGAPRRVVEGVTAVVAVLVPGATALLLICAARATLHLRTALGALLAALGVAAFFYLPAGHAIGVAVLALAAAGIVVAATGPLLAAPLASLAALIATAYLPRLLSIHNSLPNVPVTELHEALFASAGSPLWLGILVLACGAVPFAFAARRVLR